MKVVKIRLDSVLAKQIGELCDNVGLTIEQYAHQAVLAQTKLVMQRLKKMQQEARDAKENEAMQAAADVQETSEYAEK